MGKLLLALLAATFFYNPVYPQSTRLDSLSKLINVALDDNARAKLLIERSKTYPNSLVDQPLSDAQQALALYQQTKNPEGQVDAILQLSGIYSRQNKYKLAMDFDSTAYQLSILHNYKKGAALALSLMGRNQQQLGELKAAEQNCLKALDLLKYAGLEMETADVHNRLGVIYRRLSDINKSLYHFDEGMLVARKYKKDPILSVLFMNKANSYNELARYDEAIDMHLQSIRIKERIRDERGLLQSYNNIALVYMRTGELETSIGFFRKANQLARQFNNKTGLGYNYSNLATAYIKLNKTDSVEYFYEQSLENFKATEEKPGLGLVYNNYGKFLLDQGKLEKAHTALLKALDIRRSVQSPFDVASTLNTLGIVVGKMGKQKEAEEYLLQSLAMLKGENSVREKEILLSLSQHYKTIGKYEEAFKYQAGYINMHDTLVGENEVNNMLKAQSGYEVEKRDAQLALATKENQLQVTMVSKKNQQLFFSMLALAMALLLSMVFYRNYRGKRKHAIALEQKNTQIETLIRELHHRVKNNLQVVSGLLSLQSSRLEDESARQAMDEGRNRVDAMAMIHQELYMDKNLAAVDIADYLKNLSRSLANSFGFNSDNVHTRIDLPKPSLDIDMAIPIGLIVNELVTNAFKHAFKHTGNPQVNVSLHQKEAGLMELSIADNGTGVSPVLADNKSFGMKLVHTLVAQLNASIEMKQDNGTVYHIQIRA